LCRDGFHALVVLSTGHFVAAVPGAIITLPPGQDEFKVSHRVNRGTRPLNIAVTSDNHLFWGEYFDNADRDEVHIYGSRNRGETWDVVYTLPKGAVRHVHNIIYDRWADCLWVLTGDRDEESKIIRASPDWKDVEVLLSGDQQTRAVAMVPTEEGIYLASDTPLASNHVYHLDRSGGLQRLAGISSSCFYGCRVDQAIFFSTAVEPSAVNRTRCVRVYGSLDGKSWCTLLEWRKDRLPMRLFQYGTAVLPAGDNTTGLLAVTCVGVKGSDLQTSVWRIPKPAHASGVREVPQIYPVG